MTKKLFNKVLIIGVGLIGSSIARALKDYGLTGHIVGCDIASSVKNKCKELEWLGAQERSSYIVSNIFFRPKGLRGFAI